MWRSRKKSQLLQNEWTTRRFQLETYVINFRTSARPFQHVWGEVRYVYVLYRKPNHVRVTGFNNDNRKRKLRTINITHPVVWPHVFRRKRSWELCEHNTTTAFWRYTHVVYVQLFEFLISENTDFTVYPPRSGFHFGKRQKVRRMGWEHGNCASTRWPRAAFVRPTSRRRPAGEHR